MHYLLPLLLALTALATPETAAAFSLDGQGDTSISCHACVIFNSLYDVGQGFIEVLYEGLGDQIRSLLQIFLALYVVWTGTRIALGLAGIDHGLKIVSVMLAVYVAQWMLQDYSFYYDWIQEPIEVTALNISQFTITQVGGLGLLGNIQIPDADNGYARLIAMVEAQLGGILQFVYSDILKKAGSFAVLTYILGIMLLLPYLFVYCVFAAFMVEAMFKFIAVALLAPLLLAGFPFGPGRPLAIAGIRILVGAALTLVFAAAAMGLTIATVDAYQAQLGTQSNAEAVRHCEANLAAEKAANEASGANVDGWGALGGAEGDCEWASAFELDENFVVFFVIGFISVLLHLQAKGIASNLSGANDGAGPAAATVGAAKMLLGGGLAMAATAMTGQGGMRGLLQAGSQAMGGGTGNVAQAAVQHGAVGAAASMVSSPLRVSAAQAEKQQGGWNDGVGFSTGGGSGSGNAGAVELSPKTIQGIGDAMAKAINGPGGRNRGGSV